MAKRPTPTKTPRPTRQMILIYAGVALLAVWLFQSWSTPGQQIEYSTFKRYLADGRVTDVRISTTSIEGHFTRNDKKVAFSTNLLPIEDPELEPANLRAKGVRRIVAVKDNPLIGLLGYMAPFAIIIVLWLFFMKRFGPQQALGFGRSKAKLYNRKEMRTSFADVAGVDEAVAELHEVVDFLRNPKKYQRLGGRIPKGVLLVGPPGTGKTLLARAVAGEADVPFFFISGSEFVEMFVGVGAARVRELFEQAKAQSPCIIFIDELDTIGKSRGSVVTMGGHDEREQTLNQLLAEMDGFDATTGVIIMAATNRPEVLDQALLRPGRFDRLVVVDRPDLNGRLEILRVHARKVKLSEEANLRDIAAQTPGFAGAELENVINEAALLAARRGEDSVGQKDMQEAIDRVMAGLERKSRVLSEREKDIVAHHETGHALVGLLVPNHDPVHKVSIIPRGAAALGMTVTLPMEDRYLLTEPELTDRLAVLLGGRAAEEIIYGHPSTGAQDDLRKSTDIARRMVEEFGMSPRIGPVTLSQDGSRFLDQRAPWDRERAGSEQMARIADEEVSRIVTEAAKRARTLLEQHEVALRGVAAELKRVEVLDGNQLRDLVARLEAGEPTTVS
ncbi:MAG TPA: ATP-dependent zinc metalloprotease FtsH [Actinomycetota bacterium]|nr:ATP-dependent zinc metalloprotease FtsH [Actinomycetota bacterium]